MTTVVGTANTILPASRSSYCGSTSWRRQSQLAQDIDAAQFWLLSGSFASEGLRTALNGDPQGEPFKLAVDVEGANDFLGALGAMAPQAEAFIKSKSIVMAGGGTGDLIQGTAAAGAVFSELLLRSHSRGFEDESDDEGQRLAAARTRGGIGRNHGG